ncbi:MAG: RHS repeat-associated core domain-containing protein [Verrucomicrobiae bacterium]|nr:RHS repeat-associated core domain-containing protein [Verrucomicrobiae bacterium]
MTALVRGGSDAVVARYEYSAYGETLRMTGPLVKINPFRFSTKFADDASGLVYYGYRYYDPDQGRWLGRDPIEEEGGINLFAFVFNSPLNGFDPLGDFTLVEQESVAGIEGNLMADFAGAARQMWGIYDRVSDMVDAFNVIQQLAVFASETFDDDEGDMLMGFLALGSVSVSSGLKPLSERETTLYRLVDRTTDEHLKFGVTWNKDTRYSRSQLDKWNAKLIPLAKGNRKAMLHIERFLHAVHPMGRLERNKWYRLWHGLGDALK